MPLKLVQRHGSQNWYIRGTLRGRTLDESTKTSDRKTAETLLVRRAWEIEQESVFGRRATSTFLEAAVQYMDAGGERRFIKRLVDFFGATPLAKIDQRAMDKAAKTLFPNASSATINRQLFTPMSAILHRAAHSKYCDAPQFRRPSQALGRVRWITVAEAERLDEACAPHIRTLVAFLLMTGARMGEALKLDWRDVDLNPENPVKAQVSFHLTKNGESRSVPLHPVLIAALSLLPHRAGRVFRKQDGSPYKSSEERGGGGQIKVAFRGACKRAGIANFTPHDLRHTWATWHYQKHRDLLALKQLGGWKSEKMVMRYAHVNMSHLAPSIQSMPLGKIRGHG